MSNFISTDSGHHYDLDNVQSGLRYIAEQRIGAVPSHVLSLLYNAIYHIEKQNATISELRSRLLPNSLNRPPDSAPIKIDGQPHRLLKVTP